MAIAEAALDRGARVTLVAADVERPAPRGRRAWSGSRRPANCAARSSTSLFGGPGAPNAAVDVLVMAAAVADFRPAATGRTESSRGARASPSSSSRQRTSWPRSRRSSAAWTVRAGRRRTVVRPAPILVGFAAETGSLERPPGKLRRKGVDLLVANDVAEAGSGFGTDTNRVTIFDADGRRATTCRSCPSARSPTGSWTASPRAGRARRGGRRLAATIAGDPAMSATPDPVRRLTVADIGRMHADGERIPMLTAYDYPTARILDEAGIPMLLVGDSLGQVMLGYDSTVRVSMAEMLHHTAAVVRGTQRALVVGDMPFLSYASTEDAVANAGRFLREAGAQAVKVEGGVRSARIVEALVRAGHPGHGPHRLDAPGAATHGRQGPRPGQEPATRPGRSSPTRSRSRRRARSRSCWSWSRSSWPRRSRRGCGSRRSGSARAPAAAARSR